MHLYSQQILLHDFSHDKGSVLVPLIMTICSGNSGKKEALRIVIAVTGPIVGGMHNSSSFQFIDFKTAFRDSVNPDSLWKTLRGFGLPPSLS